MPISIADLMLAIHTAFQRAVDAQAWPHIIGLLVRRAEMLSRRDQVAQRQAIEWLALALHHPATTQESRAQAERLLDRLRTSMASEVFAAARERGQAHTLEYVVEQIRFYPTSRP